MEINKICFPPFWKNNPALWFSQVEAIFEVNEIKADNEKYNYIISLLDKDTLILIKDIVLTKYKVVEDKKTYVCKKGVAFTIWTKYRNVKCEIMKRLSISVLEKEVMGDKKPSDFYKHLKNIADSSVRDDIIRRIWLDGLPAYLKDILMVKTTDRSEYEKLVADNILAVFQSQKGIPEDQTNTKTVEEGRILKQIKAEFNIIKDELKELKTMVSSLENSLKKDGNQSECESVESHNRSVQSNTDNTPKAILSIENKKENEDVPLCWYHKFHGKNAHNCLKPCSYKDEETD